MGFLNISISFDKHVLPWAALLPGRPPSRCTRRCCRCRRCVDATNREIIEIDRNADGRKCSINRPADRRPKTVRMLIRFCCYYASRYANSIFQPKIIYTLKKEEWIQTYTHPSSKHWPCVKWKTFLITLFSIMSRKLPQNRYGQMMQ